MAVSRQRAPQHWAGGAGHGTHGSVRFLAIVIGLACVTAAATSLASYTSTESPPPSIDSASINTLRKNAKSGTEAQSPELQPSKSPVRVADVTDDWLQALQSSTLFRRNTSEPGRLRRDARPRVKSYSHRARTKSQRPPGGNIRYQSVRRGRWRDVPHHVRSPVRRLLLAHQFHSDQRGIRARQRCVRAQLRLACRFACLQKPRRGAGGYGGSLGPALRQARQCVSPSRRLRSGMQMPAAPLGNAIASAALGLSAAVAVATDETKIGGVGLADR